jgi:Taurine catabolism dioxygenase TauD, TfdA family
VNAIFDQVITDPAAWKSAEIGGREGLLRRLSKDEVAAIDALAKPLDRKAVHEVRRLDFTNPVVDALMAEVRQQVMCGRGAVILSGIDVERYTLERFERLYWGLGTHLGKGTIQGELGDWIARVEKSEHNPTGRGTLMDVELRPHTDMHEVMSLACVSRAAEGGESTLVSSLAVHNAIRATRPQFLAPLYEGFWAGINETIGGTKPLSDRKVPIFCCFDDKVSCYYNKYFMFAAAKRLGVQLPPDLWAAMNWFDAQAMRADLGVTFLLQPGELVFWHNWTCLHARGAFRDAPDAKRLLLRLWLNVPNGRRVDPEIAARARRVDEDHFVHAGLALPA